MFTPEDIRQLKIGGYVAVPEKKFCGCRQCKRQAYSQLKALRRLVTRLMYQNRSIPPLVADRIAYYEKRTAGFKPSGGRAAPNHPWRRPLWPGALERWIARTTTARPCFIVLPLVLLLLGGCATVYVVTGNDASISTEREVSQRIGRGGSTITEQQDDKDKDKAKDNKP